jgi:hypothetical protein
MVELQLVCYVSVFPISIVCSPHTGRPILTHDGSKDAVGRQDVRFGANFAEVFIRSTKIVES